MVKDLTVQTQRVHLVVLEYFRSGVISEALDRSRSALGLSPHVVVADGLDGDAHVVGETDCPIGARILEAWYDEHDLRNWSWEQVDGSSFSCLSGDRLVCKLGNNKISSVEPGVLVLRVGGSPRGWFNGARSSPHPENNVGICVQVRAGRRNLMFGSELAVRLLRSVRPRWQSQPGARSSRHPDLCWRCVQVRAGRRVQPESVGYELSGWRLQSGWHAEACCP